jgi:hypothetical protein
MCVWPQTKVGVPFSRINSPARVYQGGKKEAEMRKLQKVMGLGPPASTTMGALITGRCKQFL